MRKIIGAINMTLDGVCDHTVGIPDEELHQHYTKMLGDADAILYGRITYELMKFWKTLVEKPSGEKDMDDFAVAMDKVPKIVFSNTLKNTDWESATLANKSIEEIVKELKQQPGKDIYVGSKSLIIQLMNLHLMDEFQICVYPMIEGKGLSLFEHIQGRKMMKLTKTKIFQTGAIVLYYQPLI